MTTIIHHNGSLYADRYHVRAGTPVHTFHAPKIFLSEDGQFAYGVSGRSIQASEHATVQKYLRKALEFLLTRFPEDAIGTSKVFGPEAFDYMGGFGGWIYMTKDHCFLSHDTNTRDASGTTMGVGTGVWLAAGMIAAGMEPEIALASIGDLDVYTAGVIDSILNESIKPFIITGGA